MSNYRPISLCSAIAKVLEKLVTQRILSYLMKFNLLSSQQHGFLPSRSTTTQLLSCLSDWTLAKAKKEPCYVIYLDFKKAFDSVDHSKLLHKLSSYGIEGQVKGWIGSYLGNRQQRVSVEDKLSAPAPVTSGILQGSCIGPVLFVLYINDLLDLLSQNGVCVAAFADDIKLYSNDPKKLEAAMGVVEAWSQKWQLFLSAEKCQSISLGAGPQHQFTLLGHPLPQENQIKDLGIIIDPSLNFSIHIEKVAKKAKSASWVVLKCFNSGRVQALTRAYVTYIRPKVEYATQVWSPQSKADTKLIEGVQKHFTRMVWAKCFPQQVRPSYHDRLKFLNLETLESRRLKLDLSLAHKIYHGLSHCPGVLKKKILPRVLVHNMRLEKDVYKCKCRTLYFGNRIVSTWNAFSDTTLSLSVKAFKCFIDTWK